MDWIRDRALTLFLMAMFVVFLAAQFITGLSEYNATQAEHGQLPVGMAAYFMTGHPWEALFENWESEFLQMAVFVLLTTILVQKGPRNLAGPASKSSSMLIRETLLESLTFHGLSNEAAGCCTSTNIHWDWRSFCCFSCPGSGTRSAALPNMRPTTSRTATLDRRSRSISYPRGSGSSRSRIGRVSSWRSRRWCGWQSICANGGPPESKPVHASHDETGR